MVAIRTLAVLTAACLSFATASVAQEHPEVMHVHDAYARLSSMSGAVFFMIHNNGTADDRLVGARSEVAQRAGLHTHIEDANGVMMMTEIEGGVPLAAGMMHAFERGADHIMLMGLAEGLKDGDMIPLTLILESGGEVTLSVPVDNSRTEAAPMDHSGHDMSGGDASN